jgi:hypothetical protein
MIEFMEDNMVNKHLAKVVHDLMIERKTAQELKLTEEDIQLLKAGGYNLKHEKIGKEVFYYIKDVEDTNNSILISPASTKLEKVVYGEMSDIHAGSMYFCPKALEWGLKYLQDNGVNHVHISGDLVDGTKVYAGQNNWLKYWRQEDQVDCLCDILSKFKMDYIAIDGNHDMSWIKQGAPRVGELIKQRIDNFIYIPGRSDKIVRGDLVIAGVMKRLAHPWSNSSRGTYSLSYPAQTYLRNVFMNSLEFEIRDKKYPMSLLQYGHLHYDMEFTTFGVRCTFPMTFQRGNDFTEGKGLGGKVGFRLTEFTAQDGEILEYDSKSVYVPERFLK